MSLNSQKIQSLKPLCLRKFYRKTKIIRFLRENLEEELISQKLESVKGAIKANRIDEEKESEDENEAKKIEEEVNRLKEEHQHLAFKMAFHKHIFNKMLEKMRGLLDSLQKAQTNNLEIISNSKEIEENILKLPEKSAKTLIFTP